MRCFAALVPPRSLADHVVGWAEEALVPLGSVRPVDAGSLHMTLAFLGEIDGDDAARAAEIVAAVTPRPVRIRLESGLVGIPRRRPRVLALNEAGSESGSLQAELSRALVDAGLFGPDERPFWPHISVARVRRGGLQGRSGRDLLEAVGPLPKRALAPHGAERLVLFRSDLGADRARYTPLAQIPLPIEGA